MSRILVFVFLLSLASSGLIESQTTTKTPISTSTKTLKHVAKLNSILNAIQDTTTTTTTNVPKTLAVDKKVQAAFERGKEKPAALAKNLEADKALELKPAAPEANYTIIDPLPDLTNQTELANATNASGPATPGEDKSPAGFFHFVKRVFKAVTSIDRYTLILTCAFVFGVVLIGVLILIAICVCKRFDRTPTKAKGEEIGLKSPATGKRGKERSKLDFLDESKPFMETNVDAKEEPAKESDEEATVPETALIPPAKTPEATSPVAPVETPKKSLSKFSLSNIASSLSSLATPKSTAGVTGLFSKNPKGADTTSSTTPYNRQSIISGRVSKRNSVSTSQSSLAGQKPIDFDLVDQDIGILMDKAPDELKRMDSVQTLEEGGRSLVNSVSDIYRKVLLEKQQTGKLKKAKSNSQVQKLGPNEVSYNPGVDEVSLSESEKSCY